MSVHKDKQLRRNVRKAVNDNSRRFLVAMLGSPVMTRLKWAIVIIFRMGYKDLIVGDSDVQKSI